MASKKQTARTLVHTSEVFSVDVEGKSQAAILAEIKDAGYTLGSKSLSAMLSGEKDQAGDFKMTKENAETAAADQAKAAKAKKSAEKSTPTQPEATDPKAEPWPFKGQSLADRVAGLKNTETKNLTPEQAALAKQVEGQIPTKEKVSYRGTDWSKVLPQSPVAVRKDSVIHRLFTRLCDQNGASKEELMKEFGWSAGGFGGIIHWEPKAKGYFLGTEKKDGVVRYHLQFIGSSGKKVKPEEILVAEKKVAPPKEPKAAKQPAAPKEPKPAKVKVSKEQMATVPPMGGASVTTRTSKKAQTKA